MDDRKKEASVSIRDSIEYNRIIPNIVITKIGTTAELRKTAKSGKSFALGCFLLHILCEIRNKLRLLPFELPFDEGLQKELFGGHIFGKIDFRSLLA